MKRNWKEDIHDRLGNFETDAPDGLWEAIHQRMAQTERAQAEKRPAPFVLQPALRRTACAAAACLALVVGYQYFADGGKETANGVKQAGDDGMIAVGGTVASDNSRYVASKPATLILIHISEPKRRTTNSYAVFCLKKKKKNKKKKKKVTQQ